MKNIIATLFLLSALPFANAYFMDSNQLNTMAAAKDRIRNGTQRSGDWQESSYLTGYVLGVVDTLNFGVLFCLPSNATAGQLTLVVANYLREHPEKLAEDGSTLVSASLKQAFPCRK